MNEFIKPFSLIIVGFLLVTACSERPAANCPEQPPAPDTVPALLTCLGTEATAAEVEGLLRSWQRIDDEWGKVRAVDLLPAPGEELLVAYHADLQNAAWDPQGTLIVLQQVADQWKVAFDAATLKTTSPNGNPWDNWAYRILDVADATGDGRDDVLFKLALSNGMHVYFERNALLSAHQSDKLQVTFLETDHRGTYRIDEGQTEPQVLFATGDDVYAGQGAITRTYAFAGDTFVQVGQAINPDRATLSARLADGSTWYAFDRVDVLGGTSAGGPYGLYRLQDGVLTHVPIAAPVQVLQTTPAGTLYVGAGCGLLRYREGAWEELAAPACVQGSPIGNGPVTAVALGEDEVVWAGTPYSLARYDGTWQVFPINATQLLVAPDGSVWAAGWSGRAGSDCCFTHLRESEWVTYTYSAPLPVAPQLEQAIRALN